MLTSPFPLLQPFSSIVRIGLFTKDDDIHSDADAAAALGTDAATGLHQIHGNRTIVVREPSGRTEKADGMLTDVAGLALCIRWADCQNFVVIAPERRVIGVLHAGWRGVIDGTIPAFFEVMRREWDISPDQTYVGAGPSLCMRCADFTDPRTELPSMPDEFIDGKHADLQAAAARQLVDAGVSADHIDRHPDCTRCHPETYWTYRGGHREDVKAGHTNMLSCALF